MDHNKCASEILTAIGGRENLASAAHCATRLRLVIADNSKVKKTVLENIYGQYLDDIISARLSGKAISDIQEKQLCK